MTNWAHQHNVLAHTLIFFKVFQKRTTVSITTSKTCETCGDIAQFLHCLLIKARLINKGRSQNCIFANGYAQQRFRLKILHCCHLWPCVCAIFETTFLQWVLRLGAWLNRHTNTQIVAHTIIFIYFPAWHLGELWIKENYGYIISLTSPRFDLFILGHSYTL